MAKNTHFQNWQSDNINRDKCPVCWNSMGYRSRSNYCSERCVEIAKDVRTRIRASATRFIIIGFSLSFEDGCYPSLELPPFMAQFYPNGATRFFPISPRPLNPQPAIIASFWTGCVRELGWAVTDKIATMTMKKSQDVKDFRAEFEETLKDLMFLQKNVFLCPDCGGKFFDGELTRGSYGKSCCELKQAAFPF